MKKLRELDLSQTSALTVRIQGVPVSVRLDANGWPCSASTGCWHGGEEERLCMLAMAYARRLAEGAAEAAEKARSHAKRTKLSTETKREKAAEHFSWPWLAEALQKHPDMGAYRLAVAARRLLAAQPDDPNFEKRAEITEYRAKQFLTDRKNSGDM